MVVALLTDFGTQDGFVGAMKGVILSIAPDTPIVDISHEVEPFNILEGALILRAHYSYFPEKTVFVCVVDPGVGSERKALIVETPKYFFVGPDNGPFDLVLREEGSFKVYEITNERYTLPKRNNTFHGRDVFAPVGAYLKKGVKPEEIGKEIKYEFKLNFPEPVKRDNYVEGEIVHFDRFGNAITNVKCSNYAEGVFRNKKIKVVNHFLEGIPGEINAVCGSFGLMELFTPMDSAKERFSLKIGERVKFSY